jgi:DNA-binding LacI/PurR family transcriptional regulator
MNHRSITIVDLAKRLGLSKTTVADALQGSGRVAEATRHRVREAAREQGYASNRAARQLRKRSAGTIGLYIPPQIRNMTFYMPFAFGAAEGASGNESDLTLISAHVGPRPPSQLDGVIIVDALPGDPVVRQLIELPMPIVTAGRNVDIPEGRLSGVIEIEYEKLGAEMLDRLGGLGLKHPAFVSPAPGDSLSWSYRLQSGYDRWCLEHAVVSQVVTTSPFPSNDELAAALARSLGDPDTDVVLFAWQDVATRAGIQLDHLCRETGRQVHIATVASSMNDIHAAFDVVLDLRPHEFGRATAALLQDVIADPPDEVIQRIHVAEIVSPSGSGAGWHAG